MSDSKTPDQRRDAVLKRMLQTPPKPHKPAKVAHKVRLRLDASPALSALVQVRNRLLEVREGQIDLPEGVLESLGFNFDLVSATGAGDFTYRLNVTDLDRVLRAATGAVEG